MAKVKQPGVRAIITLPPQVRDWVNNRAVRLGISRNAVVLLALNDAQNKADRENAVKGTK